MEDCLNHYEIKNQFLLKILRIFPNIDKPNKTTPMKFLSNLILILCCCAAMTAFGQTQNIRGTVFDKDTKQPIGSALLSIGDGSSGIGTYSEEDGTFLLENIPLGRHIINCQIIGYDNYRSEALIITSAKVPYLEIAMGSGIDMTEVEITDTRLDYNAPLNESAFVSARSFSVEETERMPAGVNDMGRMALSFPGVSQGGDDTENDIIIRGNSSFGMLWRLEGVDIPNPNHFARPGTSGGGITVFSAQLLGRSDFFSGGMPAEYGNALSGAFDVHFKKGNKHDREYRAKIGILGLDFATEGPIQKERSSYIFNYRYSTLGLLNSAGLHLLGERISNDFQDLSFNISLDSKDKKHLFTVFGMGGLSTEHYQPVADFTARDSSVANHWEDRVRISNLGIVGATYTWLIDEKSFLKAAIVGNFSVIDWQYDTVSSAESARFRYNTELYEDQRISTSLSYNRKVSPTFKYKVGLMNHNINFNFFKETAPRTASSDITVFNNEISLAGSGMTSTLQTYAQGTYQPNERHTLNFGVHALYLGLNNTAAIDPRFSYQFKINAQHTLGLAIGKHSQMLPLAAYFYSKNDTTVNNEIITSRPNEDMSFINSWHSVLSYSFLTKSQIKFVTEFYYQRLNKVPISIDNRAENTNYWMLNDQQSFAFFETASEGTGQNYGIDMVVEKFFSNKMYFLITGSMFESKYTPQDGIQRNTKFGTRWSSSYTIGREFEFGNAKTLQVGFRILYNGGFRYSPYDPIASAAESRYVMLAGEEWSAQVPAYKRVDARIAYRYNAKRFSGSISLDIQNLTSERNINAVAYNSLDNALEFRNYPGGDFIPVLAFQFDF